MKVWKITARYSGDGGYFGDNFVGETREEAEAACREAMVENGDYNPGKIEIVDCDEVVPRKVYLVEGCHWHVPGAPQSVHATMDGANARARELVNIMLGDVELKPGAGNWEEDLARIKTALAENDAADPDDCDVWITEFVIKED